MCLDLQLASGGVFGMDQPISFQLLGSEESQVKLEGVAMELEDSLYPLLREVTACLLVICNLLIFTLFRAIIKQVGVA